jgi:hypothetical protein
MLLSPICPCMMTKRSGTIGRQRYAIKKHARYPGLTRGSKYRTLTHDSLVFVWLVGRWKFIHEQTVAGWSTVLFCDDDKMLPDSLDKTANLTAADGSLFATHTYS